MHHDAARPKRDALGDDPVRAGSGACIMQLAQVVTEIAAATGRQLPAETIVRGSLPFRSSGPFIRRGCTRTMLNNNQQLGATGSRGSNVAAVKARTKSYLPCRGAPNQDFGPKHETSLGVTATMVVCETFQ
ncbi:Cytochrome P450 [Anopheles sinensis]|uniref:Cytochrome P450 n=1 Tax=Anopheles sinensis TaxID=74873 RepID=A0A084WUV4_ANOSI|nr:Cytochrome P450 [Anopheles sinensis]